MWEDLLAVDKNGDLWRYEFDPTAFWPLKEKNRQNDFIKIGIR